MGRKPLHPKPDNEPLPPDPVEESNVTKLQFRVVTYRPDQREYRQQSLELTPERPIVVSIDVPKDLVYVGSQEDILELAGLKYVIDQFDAIFLPNKKEVVSSPDDEWEKEGEEPEAETASSSNDDEWETEPEDKNETDKMPWDEANEEWS